MKCNNAREKVPLGSKLPRKVLKRFWPKRKCLAYGKGKNTGIRLIFIETRSKLKTIDHYLLSETHKDLKRVTRIYRF